MSVAEAAAAVAAQFSDEDDTDDDEAGVAAGEAWVLGLPDARGVVLPGVGRFPWVEAPDRFFAEVNGFLDAGS